MKRSHITRILQYVRRAVAEGDVQPLRVLSGTTGDATPSDALWPLSRHSNAHIHPQASIRGSTQATEQPRHAAEAGEPRQALRAHDE